MREDIDQREYFEDAVDALIKSAEEPINLKNVNVVQWNRVDHFPTFRAEWREKEDDFVYNFYHKKGPDPMLGYDDPDAVTKDEDGNTIVKVEHGSEIALPISFVNMLKAIMETVYSNVRFHLEMVPETLSWSLTIYNAAVKFTMRPYLTTGLFDTVAANIPAFCPELTS